MRTQQITTTPESLCHGRSFQPEHINFVRNLLQKDLTDTENIIGYHGTSIGAVLAGLETGFIPTGLADGCTNHLYFFPTPEIALKYPNYCEKPMTIEGAIDEAKDYAEDLTQLYLTAHHLRIDLSTRELRNAVLSAIMEHSLDETTKKLLLQSGLSPETIQRTASNLNKNALGCILALHRNAFELDLSTGDSEYKDLKILCPHGLSIELIAGIHPIGKFDSHVLRHAVRE